MKGKSNPTISQYGRLSKELAFHEQAVAALRFTLSLLSHQAQASSASRAGQTIAAAIKHDVARRAPTTTTGKRRGRPPKQRADDAPTKRYGKRIRKQRQRTAKFLDQFSTTQPTPAKGGRGTPLAAVIRRGYLVANGDGGYLRTAKEFVI